MPSCTMRSPIPRCSLRALERLEGPSCITSANAGIPVTHRALATSVTFVTGHEDPAKPSTQTNWTALAKSGGTIVLYMGVKTLASIADALIKGGMPGDIPAAAIQW